MNLDVNPIVLVEDNPHDVEMAVIALEKNNLANRLVILRDGEEALDYLFRRRAYETRQPGNPAVVLLDLKMPKVGGLEVLTQIRSNEKLKHIPVVILTSSREEQDLVQSYDLGVNAYVVKPVDFQQFVEAVKHLGLFWSVVNEPPPGTSR